MQRFNYRAAYGPDRETGDPVKTLRLSPLLTTSKDWPPPEKYRPDTRPPRGIAGRITTHRRTEPGPLGAPIPVAPNAGHQTLLDRLKARYADQWTDRPLEMNRR